ncbi:DUF3262 family protein [bacterium]|nr:DUF3262 family protein [bacterium]
MSILSRGFLDQAWQSLNTHVVFVFTQADANTAFANGSGIGLAAMPTLNIFFETIFLVLIYIGAGWSILSELHNWGAKGSGFGELMMVVTRAAVLPLMATLFAAYF